MEAFVESTLARARVLWAQATEIWAQGDWAMIAIAVIALVMFGLGVHIWIELRATGFRQVPEWTWRRWIDYAEEREGPIGEILDLVVGDGRSNDSADVVFEQLKTKEMVPFERDLKVMKVCVSAAPLVGLLGTVTGMLSTFGALSSGSGGDQTMQSVAAGISEALITTETGLVIAIPGLFLQYQLVRNFERYKAFLAHLETVCNQTLFRRRRAGVTA